MSDLSAVLSAHVFRPSMMTRIARFGFELEMLDEGDQGGEVWVNCDACNGTGEVECGECGHCSECGDCEGEGGSYREGASDRVETVLGLASASIGHRTDLCCYHCRCRQCDPRRSAPFMTAQEDCTVGVEFITKICDVNDTTDIDQIAEVVRWYGQVLPFWRPDGRKCAGNHVHVSCRGADDGEVYFTPRRRGMASQLIRSVYGAWDWEEAAGGGCGRVRGYNSKPYSPHDGSWLSERTETFEHRLWNTPAEPERIFGHVAASIAVQRWAFATTFNPRYEMAALTGRMFETVASMHEQIRDQIIQYLPTDERLAGAGYDILMATTPERHLLPVGVS